MDEFLLFLAHYTLLRILHCLFDASKCTQPRIVSLGSGQILLPCCSEHVAGYYKLPLYALHFFLLHSRRICCAFYYFLTVTVSVCGCVFSASCFFFLHSVLFDHLLSTMSSDSFTFHIMLVSSTLCGNPT